MDVAELANYLGIPISTVYDWRVHGKGPTAYRFGKHLKFAISDVGSVSVTVFPAFFISRILRSASGHGR
ncbi:helix-turn-helix domain-containing protein [Cryobacterium sp. Hb1]|uniref:helix-turn-helix domain-containing protein n=1 Tax=Cryobacterium sp. Hb1 TaxID=1259147 RepID=UPI001069F819|nr:helix-turn-helix domain-containing protein [Cryobacterium sp. Hb1]TFD70507.1 DNA-binding protein [Cryobacterium sp. Hb1]